MWRSCQGQPSHKERAIGVVRCKKEGMLLQSLRWCCVDCVIHHERDVREEQKYMYVARTSNNRVIPKEWSWWVTSNDACEPGEQLIVLANGDDESDLYCCLLPRCEALHTCRSGFPIATLSSPQKIGGMCMQSGAIQTFFSTLFGILALFQTRKRFEISST